MAASRSQRSAEEIVVIDMNERDATCSACGAEFVARRVGGQGLPWRDGEIVEVDDSGEWAGMDACAECVAAYERGGSAEVWAKAEVGRG